MEKAVTSISTVPHGLIKAGNNTYVILMYPNVLNRF